MDLKKLQRELINVAYEQNVGHIGSSLSCLPLINDIYESDDDFRFILSKGHAALALYTVLWAYNRIPEHVYRSYCEDGSEIYGHVSYSPEYGVDATCGSLGHGIGIACGYALADPHRRVYVVCGDGETNEGSFWESMAFGVAQSLKNLHIIIDSNKFQGFGATKDVLGEISYSKLSGFNDCVYLLDENSSLDAVLKLGRENTSSKPKIYLCNTKKGGKIKYLSGKGNKSHYLKLSRQDYDKIMEELR